MELNQKTQHKFVKSVKNIGHDLNLIDAFSFPHLDVIMDQVSWLQPL